MVLLGLEFLIVEECWTISGVEIDLKVSDLGFCQECGFSHDVAKQAAESCRWLLADLPIPEIRFLGSRTQSPYRRPPRGQKHLVFP